MLISLFVASVGIAVFFGQEASQQFWKENALKHFTYILIHGAWHGAWCWRKVTQPLLAAGHTVIAPDLPGLGMDQTKPSHVSFYSGVARVLDLVDRASGPVILVGHSLGGMTISQVAEERPDKIRWLVYLTALLPQNGESALDIQNDFPALDTALARSIDSNATSVRLNLDDVPGLFYHDCEREDVLFAQKLLRPQPLQPLNTPVALSQEFERVPRVYITCAYDRVISPEAQEQMYRATPCEHVLWLPSGHAPFWSIPTRLAARLQGLSLAASYPSERRCF